jgi:hypothetical protein
MSRMVTNLELKGAIPADISPGQPKCQTVDIKTKYNRINARKLELENLPSNLAEYNTSKEVDIVDDQLKIKALIEYKSLCLLNKQKALRQELVSRRASMPSEPEIRAANNEAGPRFGPWLSALSRPPSRWEQRWRKEPRGATY